MSFTLAALAITSAVSAGVNWYYQNKANKRSESQLGLQEDSYDESLRSNYFNYMQKLESMNNEYAQDSLAIDQQRENIASNQNYLDRWANEYDQSMQSNIDEAYNQYQTLASNYASGLVNNAETGRVGGTAGRAVQDTANQLKSMNGGTTEGINLTGSRLGSYLQSASLDMMSDKQTAISGLQTSYKAIDSYKTAMSELNANIDYMAETTNQIKVELAGKGIGV